MSQQAFDTLSPSSLAESLTADLNQTTQSQHDETVRELEAFIASVPARTEITNTRRWFYGGIIMIAVFVILTVAAVSSGASQNMFIFMGVMLALSVIMLLNHLNAGKVPHTVLTHEEISFANFSAPVKLVNITDIELQLLGQMDMVLLDLAEGTPLPTFKRRRGFFAPQAGIRKRRNKPDQILIASGGFQEVGGKKMNEEELGGLLSAYINVAHAHQQLAELRAGRVV